MGCEYSCINTRSRKIASEAKNIKVSRVSSFSENSLKVNPSSIYLSTTKLDFTEEQIEMMKSQWSETLMAQRSDIFHKAMLMSVESSPRMNEIIACQRYCYRDLTKWPKLNQLCQAQREFFRHLIIDLSLSEKEVRQEATRLGRTHASMAQYGLKPHFLDIWSQQFQNLLERLKMDNDDMKLEYLKIWATLLSFVIESMNSGYSKEMEVKRKDAKRSDDTHTDPFPSL